MTVPLIFHRLDAVREMLATLPANHAMRPYWEHVEEKLRGALAIMTAEKRAA